MNNKYSLISQSGISKSKTSEKDTTQKLVFSKSTDISFTLKNHNHSYIDDRKEALKNELLSIKETSHKNNMGPMDSYIKLNSQTFVYLRTYYGYSIGDVNNPKNLMGYELQLDESLDKKVLIISKYHE